MNIVYFGKGARGKICLQAILSKGYLVKCFIGENVSDEGYIYAKNIGIRTLIAHSPNNSELEKSLKKINADLFILSGWSKILRKNIIDLPKITTINLHGGALPNYRGASVINWQIINGEKEGGCCIIEVDEGIDTGPILSQKKYKITNSDTHYSILEKTLIIFPNMLIDVLENLSDRMNNKINQLNHQGKKYRKRKPEDSKILWSKFTNYQVYNLIRGMCGPFPWAFSYLVNQKIEFKTAKVIKDAKYEKPGKVSKITNEGVLISCLNSNILIYEIKIQNKLIKANNYFKINDQLI